MSHLQQLKARIEVIRPREAIFDLTTRWGGELHFSSRYRDKYQDEDEFYQDLFEGNIKESFSFSDKKYYINKQETMQAVMATCQTTLRHSIYSVCPAKRPRQTKFFKEFDNFMLKLSVEQEDINETVLSLVRYHYDNNDDMNAETEKGKTFYLLLQAFVKKYKR